MSLLKRGCLATLGIVGLLLCLRIFVFSDRTLPIEGVVTDARTGKPIPQVIVTASWDMHQPFGVGTGKGYRTVTDEQGRYRVPGKWLVTLISKFDFLSLRFYHPLYDFANQPIFSKHYGGYKFKPVERGRVVGDVGMLSLEDRFAKPEDNSELATYFSAMRPDFFLVLRDKYDVRYDLKEVLAKWEYVAMRYPQGVVKNGYHRVQMYFVPLEFQMRKILPNY